MSPSPKPRTPTGQVTEWPQLQRLLKRGREFFLEHEPSLADDHEIPGDLEWGGPAFNAAFRRWRGAQYLRLVWLREHGFLGGDVLREVPWIESELRRLSGRKTKEEDN